MRLEDLVDGETYVYERSEVIFDSVDSGQTVFVRWVTGHWVSGQWVSGVSIPFRVLASELRPPGGATRFDRMVECRVWMEVDDLVRGGTYLYNNQKVVFLGPYNRMYARVRWSKTSRGEFRVGAHELILAQDRPRKMEVFALREGETYLYHGAAVVFMGQTSEGMAVVRWASGLGGPVVDPALLKPLPTRFTRCLREG